MILNALPSTKFEIVRDTLDMEENRLNVSLLCEIAGVSRSGYYRWLAAEPYREEAERQDIRDFGLILSAYRFKGYDKGVQGIHMRLLHQKPAVVMNPKKIRRLMRKYDLRCPIRRPNPYRSYSKVSAESKTAPNLLNREFRAHGERSVLLTDITYIPHGGRFSYLSVIMDAYTKEILAHALSRTLEEEFVLETVRKLMLNHADELKTDALIHSDQGLHYSAHKFVDLIRDSELRQSMSRRGNCWDNAPQESFFGHMKDEINVNDGDSFAYLSQKIDRWIRYYNHDRYQWNLEKLSPAEYFLYVTTGVYPLESVTIPRDADKRGDKRDSTGGDVVVVAAGDAAFAELLAAAGGAG